MRNRDNDIIKGIMAVCLLTLLTFISGYVYSHYTINGVVTDIRGAEVLVTDQMGNIWGVYADGYSEGDIVKLTMNTNLTDDTNLDDKVEKIRML